MQTLKYLWGSLLAPLFRLHVLGLLLVGLGLFILLGNVCAAFLFLCAHGEQVSRWLLHTAVSANLIAIGGILVSPKLRGYFLSCLPKL